MILSPPQAKILLDPHRFRVLVCGRKFGKTTLFLEEMVGMAISRPEVRVLYIAPTLLDARALLWDKLLKILGRAVVSKNDTLLEMKVRTLKGGTSDIFLGSWEKVENYRGLEYDFILMDEVQDYRNFWVGWGLALRPTLTPRKGQAIFAGTPKGFNHFYDLYNMPYKNPEWASFHYTSYDNPYLDRKEIDNEKLNKAEDEFAQEYLAEFRKSEGLVFKEFSRETHVFTEELKEYSELLAGVDWGFQAPAAVPTVKTKGNAYYVTDLLYRTHMNDDAVADYVASKRFTKVYPDPESASGVDLLKKKGVNVREVSKGKDSIKFGIGKMRELFKQNRLFIHSSCLDLIAELETYAYPEKSPHHNPSENPIDENNHAIDALRYVVMSHTMGRPFIKRPFYDKTVDIWRGR